jgi:hypothetical protein
LALVADANEPADAERLAATAPSHGIESLGHSWGPPPDRDLSGKMRDEVSPTIRTVVSRKDTGMDDETAATTGAPEEHAPQGPTALADHHKAVVQR